MRKESLTAPRNSLVLVMDRTVADIPASMSHGLVAATESCVAIGTLSELDGETSISLSDEEADAGSGEAPVFDGVLNTPSGKLSVCSVLDEVLLECDVSSCRSRVRVWANHSSEPDEIRIVVTAT